jgi:hypothetical protein
VPFYALMAVFVVSEQRTRIRSLLDRGGTHLDRGSFYAVVAALGAGFAGGFLCASLVGACALGAGRWPVCIAGLVVIGLGLGLRQWAVLTLGRVR